MEPSWVEQTPGEAPLWLGFRAVAFDSQGDPLHSHKSAHLGRVPQKRMTSSSHLLYEGILHTKRQRRCVLFVKTRHHNWSIATLRDFVWVSWNGACSTYLGPAGHRLGFSARRRSDVQHLRLGLGALGPWGREVTP